MCKVWVTLSRASWGRVCVVGPAVGFPVASLPVVCPPLASLAVSPRCLAVPWCMFLFVISALAYAKKLGCKYVYIYIYIEREREYR